MTCINTCALIALLVAIVAPVLFSHVADGSFRNVYPPPSFSLTDLPDLNGKVAIVTGANTGIGKETAKALARYGATVVLAVRNQTKGQIASQEVRDVAQDPSKVKLRELDLASLKSVRDFASDMVEELERLDILVNNAGVMGCPFSLTQQGVEMQFGVNHLGHYLLTERLAPLLQATAASRGPVRVVNVSSKAHFIPFVASVLAPVVEAVLGAGASDGADFHNVRAESEATYETWIAYGRSKLANMVYTKHLAHRFKDHRVYVNAVHPGLVATELLRHARHTTALYVNTNLARDLDALTALLSLSPAQGAMTSVYAAASRDIEDKDIRGQYLVPYGRVTAASVLAEDPAVQANLIEASKQLVEESGYGQQ